MHQIDKFHPPGLLDPQTQGIKNFLEQLGLPFDNIIADQSDREIIVDNLPSYINSLPIEVKRDARYLSKFVVGAGIGLFDYSLNAIWNEVTLDLRKKAIAYGIDIFFDAAVGGHNREFYQDESDLSSLKDVVLLNTCKKLELIGDTTHKKLLHILDMRNDIGISHPTNYTINAFELLGWLQTCIKDILEDQPSEAALKVKEFIRNLQKNNTPLDKGTQNTIQSKICELPSHLCGSLLRTVFGIFVSDDTDIQIRKNISLIASPIWNYSSDEYKYKLGVILEGYKSNLQTGKYDLGEQFFHTVNGNAFRTSNDKVLIIDELLDDLFAKHYERDNFHHEAPIVAKVSSFIRNQTDIIPNNSNKLAKVILLCRIGREVSYCNGISPKGKEYYDNLLSLLGDKYAPLVLISLNHSEIQEKLNGTMCRVKAKEALEIVKQSLLNERLIECFQHVTDKIEHNPNCIYDTKFKNLFEPYACNS